MGNILLGVSLTASLEGDWIFFYLQRVLISTCNINSQWVGNRDTLSSKVLWSSGGRGFKFNGKKGD